MLSKENSVKGFIDLRRDPRPFLRSNCGIYDEHQIILYFAKMFILSLLLNPKTKSTIQHFKRLFRWFTRKLFHSSCESDYPEWLMRASFTY